MEFNRIQLERIAFMKAIAKETSKTELAVLKGGTALLLGHGLERFSEDMDFNLPKGSVADLKKHILTAAQFTGITIKEIYIKKNTDTTKRYTVHYDSEFFKGNYPLKIECSLRDDINLNDVEKIDGISIYKIRHLARLKTDAFINRSKGRDTFDIVFLLNKYPNEVDQETWQRIEEHVNTKGIDNLCREFDLEAKEDILLSEFNGTEILLSLQEILDKHVRK